MTFQPEFYPQRDGTEFQWLDCVAAGACEAIDRDTRGVTTSRPATVRAITGDRFGGLTLEQADYALRQVDGKDHLDVRPKISWTEAMAMLDRGQGMMAVLSYGVIVDAGYNFGQSSGFRDNHQIYFNHRNIARTNIFGYDPLIDGRSTVTDGKNGPQWYPVSVLKKAAGAVPGIGYGYVQAAFTRDTEPSYRVHVHPTYFARYIVTDGVITGLRKQLTGGFVTPVSAPKLLTYPPQIVNGVTVTHSSRSVVQIPPTRAEYGGWYIGSAGANVTLEVLP